MQAVRKQWKNSIVQKRKRTHNILGLDTAKQKLQKTFWKSFEKPLTKKIAYDSIWKLSQIDGNEPW